MIIPACDEENTLEHFQERHRVTLAGNFLTESLDNIQSPVKFILAYNHNTIPNGSMIDIDSDGDGLSDTDEMAANTNLRNWDTDNDGMSDFFEIRNSSPGHVMDPLQPDSPCEYPMDHVWPDSDLDGLSDCEEYVKGTDPYFPDTDRDGIPDGIEFVAGTNPLETQLPNDSDFDGVPDNFEIQQYSSVRISEPKIHERYVYADHIHDEGLMPLDQDMEQTSYVRQYSFLIEGIDLVDTEGTVRNDGTHLFEGDNIISLYIVQVPADNPQGPPIFRKVECIVNVSDANKTIVLTSENRL